MTTRASRLRAAGLSRPAVAVFLTVEIRARGRGFVEISTPELVESTGYSTRSVERARRELVAAGLVHVVSGAGRNVSRWTVLR